MTMCDNGNKFPGWPKTPRLTKDVTLTEKVDGTNGLIHIRKVPFGTGALPRSDGRIYATDPGAATVDALPLTELEVRAGSRNRWLSAGADNYGFWQWVNRNANGLAQLGPGSHYGEWYGHGIQRNYGLTTKNFALFNVGRFKDNRDGAWNEDGYPFPNAVQVPAVDGLTTVPMLGVITGDHAGVAAISLIRLLEDRGSYVTDQNGNRTFFSKPEGICLYFEPEGFYRKYFTKWDAK